MKQRTARLAAIALLLSIPVALVVLLSASYSSLHPRCGLLPSRQDPFLDNSGRCFQKVSWHLGNARRTWGETYGFKLGRVYVTLGVKHINPRVTFKEADEDD